jgi:hypothetical protein
VKTQTPCTILTPTVLSNLVQQGKPTLRATARLSKLSYLLTPTRKLIGTAQFTKSTPYGMQYLSLMSINFEIGQASRALHLGWASLSPSPRVASSEYQGWLSSAPVQYVLSGCPGVQSPVSVHYSSSESRELDVYGQLGTRIYIISSLTLLIG